MRRLSALFCLAFIGISITLAPSANAVTNILGGKCTKIGVTTKVNNSTLICTKSGAKKIWKAAPIKKVTPSKNSSSSGPKIGDLCAKVGELLPYAGHSIRCMENGTWADW